MTQSAAESQWTSQWLDSVADGSALMSQLRVTFNRAMKWRIRCHPAYGEEKKVHLLLLEDEKENEVVAASRKSFIVLC